MGLGARNVDHVILDAETAIVIDATGIDSGKLTLNDRDHCTLIRPDGSCVPQPWMDSRRNYAYMAVMYRLTGLPRHLVWLLPGTVDLDEHTLPRARCSLRVALSSRPPSLSSVLAISCAAVLLPPNWSHAYRHSLRLRGHGA
jgi:hypothetical protein